MSIYLFQLIFEKKTKNKGKELCMSVYQRRHFKPKSLKRQDSKKNKKSEMTDIPSLIWKSYIIKKASQTDL